MAQRSTLVPAAAVLLAALAAACGSPVGATGAGSTVLGGEVTSSPGGSPSSVPTATATSPQAPTHDAPSSSVRTQSEPDPQPTAQGSPIDVPTIPDPHIPMDGLKESITALFERACGVGPGEPLCVRLVFTDGACFVGYHPSTTAARGSKVTVVTESQEQCDAANQPTDPPPTTDDTSTGTGGGTPTESTAGAPHQSQDQPAATTAASAPGGP